MTLQLLQHSTQWEYRRPVALALTGGLYAYLMATHTKFGTKTGE